MTDEEKRAAIEALVDAEPPVNDDCPAPEFLARVRSMCARIRAILDDAPSVVWTEDHEGTLRADLDDSHLFMWPHGGGWRLEISSDSDTPGALVDMRLWSIEDAQRRAVALYVALRGVT